MASISIRCPSCSATEGVVRNGKSTAGHQRYLDVSTLKELARRWKPEILDGFTKQGTHQAMDDIRESVVELAYYREHFIKL